MKKDKKNKQTKIIWDNGNEWILAPKNIEYVEGKFKDITSLCNIDVYVPMKYYKKYNQINEKYVRGTITGTCDKNTFNVLIGECY